MRSSDSSSQESVQYVLKENGLECSIKDIDTDITTEKSELLNLFGAVEGKIKTKIASEPSSKLNDLVDSDCREYVKLQLLSLMLVQKAEPCIISSNFAEQELNIVQEFVKRVCDEILQCEFPKYSIRI